MKTKAIPTETEINEKMLASAQSTLTDVDAVADRVAGMQSDTAYDHAQTHERLKKMADDLQAKHETLTEEIACRKVLAAALKSGDKEEIAKARQALKDQHTANKSVYAGASSIRICAKCLSRKLDKVSKARHPQTVDEMIDVITGVFEGREPDYCALADNPKDPGRLSYGKHQASETSGNLYAMLAQYSRSADPAPDPELKATIDSHLANFNSGHNSYNGSAEDRAAFKATLKKACKDPAMKTVQDDYFATNFMAPALSRASSLCVRSALGKSMMYDMAIQTSPRGNAEIIRRTRKSLGMADDGKCQPCDPDGPSEEEFLGALNAERRGYVTALGGPAADSVYREDFFDTMLQAHNNDLSQDFVVKGVPVKGLPKSSE